MAAPEIALEATSPTLPLGRAAAGLAEFARHWPVALGSALGVALGLSLFPLYVMPLLGLQLEHSLGWSRVDSASLITTMNLAGLAGVLFAGRIVETFGSRWPAVISTAAMGALLMAAPLLPHSVSAWRIGAGVFVVAGCATAPVAYAKAICEAFSRARGLALGLTLGAIGLAGAVVPSVLIALMGRLGAERALQVMGVAYVFVLAPLIAILLRGSAHRAASAIAASAAAGGAITTPLTRPRWMLLTLGFVLLSAAAYGAAVSIPGIARDSHAGSPVLMLAALSLSVMIARPLAGFAIDLAPAQIVAAGVAACTAAGLLLTAFVPHCLALGAVAVGLSLGAEIDILAFLVSRYVAPQRQSRTYSQIWFLVGISLSIAPLAFAQARVHAGSYGPVLIGAAAVVLIGGLLIGASPAYPRPERDERP